jgi:hypothetical protein
MHRPRSYFPYHPSRTTLEPACSATGHSGISTADALDQIRITLVELDDVLAGANVDVLSLDRHDSPFRPYTQKPRAKHTLSLLGRSGSFYASALLLLDGPFRGGQSLESSVRDRLAAFDRKSVRSGGQSSLRALNGSELLAEILGATGVELVLIEVFGIVVTWFSAIGTLEGSIAVERGQSRFDARTLEGKQLARAFRLHTQSVLAVCDGQSNEIVVALTTWLPEVYPTHARAGGSHS